MPQVVTAQSEQELLVLVAEGDRRAFGLLHDLLRDRVMLRVHKYLLDWAQSEEVSQEVFLEVWTHAPRYKAGKGSATAWVLTIASHRAIDRVRASQASRDRDFRIGIRELEVHSDDLETQAEIRWEHRRAMEAMASLTAVQREVVELVYVNELSMKEVASALSLPEGTVRTRLRDSLMRLKAELQRTRRGAAHQLGSARPEALREADN